MNRIVHFEIHVDNAERAIKFYKEVFSWSFDKWGDNDYWMVITAEKDSKVPGINGGLLPRSIAKSKTSSGANAFVCTVQVESFDNIAERIISAGGAVAMPKYAFPGMAWQGYFTDTEGNTLGLHQTDPNAR